MVLKNLQSKNILISSDSIDDVIANPLDYLKILISLKKNCCTTEYEDEVEVAITKKWYVNILKPNNTRIALAKFIYMKNFDTGEIFKIDLTTFTIEIASCTELDYITTIINQYIDANFPATEDLSEIPDTSDSSESDSSDSDTITVNNTVASECDSSDATNFKYSIWSLPDNIVPLYFEYEFDGVTILESFYSTYSDKNTILTNEHISLDPLIIDDEKFGDGVYTVAVTIIKNSGTQIVESQCFFLDCHTKCNTVELAMTLKDADQTEILMLHYGLTIGSNCACSCSDLCILWGRLAKWLNKTEETCNCG